MDIVEIRDRATQILNKYEHYLRLDPAERPSSGDPFQDEYGLLVDRVQDLTLKAEQVTTEKNKAVRAAVNAEIRQEKASLLENEIANLRKLADTLKRKSPAEVVLWREQQIQQLIDAISDVRDGVGGSASPLKQPALRASFKAAVHGNIAIDSTKLDGRIEGEGYYTHTEATSSFVREAEQARQRQDRVLERIEAGLGTLKEELDRHDVLVDEIHTKINKVNTELKNNNMRLQGLVTKMRKPRNFIMDVILICVLLGIGVYIFIMLKNG